ncbi:hypothetical protein [Rhodopirellula sallentina]|nr:hypothetical protein [Rhodopirellula sallentina]
MSDSQNVTNNRKTTFAFVPTLQVVLNGGQAAEATMFCAWSEQSG